MKGTKRKQQIEFCPFCPFCGAGVKQEVTFKPLRMIMFCDNEHCDTQPMTDALLPSYAFAEWQTICTAEIDRLQADEGEG